MVRSGVSTTTVSVVVLSVVVVSVVEVVTAYLPTYVPAAPDFGYAKVDLANARDEQGNPTRQPGSSFKPFVLATALEKGIPLTKTYSGASPMTLRPPGQAPFTLENFEQQFRDGDVRKRGGSTPIAQTGGGDMSRHDGSHVRTQRGAKRRQVCVL